MADDHTVYVAAAKGQLTLALQNLRRAREAGDTSITVAAVIRLIARSLGHLNTLEELR